MEGEKEKGEKKRQKIEVLLGKKDDFVKLFKSGMGRLSNSMEQYTPR